MRDMPPNLVDYEKTYREFKWEIPEYYNFGFDGIDRWAEDRTSEKLSREILEHVGRRLEPQRCPRELEFLSELPKTTTGKIKRSELKSREVEKRRGRPISI